MIDLRWNETTTTTTWQWQRQRNKQDEDDDYQLALLRSQFFCTWRYWRLSPEILLPSSCSTTFRWWPQPFAITDSFATSSFLLHFRRWLAPTFKERHGVKVTKLSWARKTSKNKNRATMRRRRSTCSRRIGPEQTRTSDLIQHFHDGKYLLNHSGAIHNLSIHRYFYWGFIYYARGLGQYMVWKNRELIL